MTKCNITNLHGVPEKEYFLCEECWYMMPAEEVAFLEKLGHYRLCKDCLDDRDLDKYFKAMQEVAND